MATPKLKAIAKAAKAAPLHPMIDCYLDGLDASTDGRGFDAKHETARLFVQRACDELTAREAAPPLCVFQVTPDWRNGGDDWQTFVACGTPEEALRLTAAHIGIEAEAFTFNAAPVQDTGNEAWRVNHISGATISPGVVQWDAIPATFWTMHETPACD